MKDTLQTGISYKHKFVIPESKTVPALYPEAEEFAVMPEVLATGFMVGLLEWACIKAINPLRNERCGITARSHFRDRISLIIDDIFPVFDLLPRLSKTMTLSIILFANEGFSSR